VTKEKNTIFKKYQNVQYSCLFARYEGVWGSGSVTPLVRNLGTAWKWVISSTSWLLFLRANFPPLPIDKKILFLFAVNVVIDLIF